MQRGFNVTTILMDGQSEYLSGDLDIMHIHLSTNADNAQVGDIKRMILTIKKRAHGIFNTSPFIKLTGRIIVELVDFFVFWLNALGNSVAGDLSVHTVITRLTVTYNQHCCLEFGEYV